MVDARHHGAKEAFHLGAVAGGQAHGAVGHAVVGAAAGDDLVAFGEAAQNLHLFGNLDRRLHRFRAARAEEDPLQIARCDLR